MYIFNVWNQTSLRRQFSFYEQYTHNASVSVVGKIFTGTLSNSIYKGKVVSVFLLTEHYIMKAYWGSRDYSCIHSLTSALDGGEWSASRLGRFIPRERPSGTNWIRGWVGPRAVLDCISLTN